MDGEQVEAALSAARRGGLEPAVLHALDVDWLRRERPALLLTQDACLSCEAVAGTVHAALEAAGLERERALTLAPKSVDGMLRAMRTVGCVALRRLHPHVVEAAPACSGGCTRMHHEGGHRAGHGRPRGGGGGGRARGAAGRGGACGGGGDTGGGRTYVGADGGATTALARARERLPFRLQPYVIEAAALRGRGCNPMW